jgi:hypothetical protein
MEISPPSRNIQRAHQEERLAWSKRPVDELVKEKESTLRFVGCESICLNKMCQSYNAIVEDVTAVAYDEELAVRCLGERHV